MVFLHAWAHSIVQRRHTSFFPCSLAGQNVGGTAARAVARRVVSAFHKGDRVVVRLRKSLYARPLVGKLWEEHISARP